MKKLLFVCTIFCMVYGCKDKYPDELVAKLTSKKVPEDVGKKMKKHFNDSGKSPVKYIFHWEFYEGLLAAGVKNVYIMPIRYSKDEEQYYRDAWGLSATDSAGYVDGYSSFIIQVGTNTEYYQFTQFCPPPETCRE
ncbi:MAG TPA: hypothetical protein VMY77_13145 [Chitinophagaceae bacterium]|nr:hypothetical protein [Chitinophagaceae bacterium]